MKILSFLLLFEILLSLKISKKFPENYQIKKEIQKMSIKEINSNFLLKFSRKQIQNNLISFINQNITSFLSSSSSSSSSVESVTLLFGSNISNNIFISSSCEVIYNNYNSFELSLNTIQNLKYISQITSLDIVGCLFSSPSSPSSSNPPSNNLVSLKQKKIENISNNFNLKQILRAIYLSKLSKNQSNFLILSQDNFNNNNINKFKSKVINKKVNSLTAYQLHPITSEILNNSYLFNESLVKNDPLLQKKTILTTLEDVSINENEPTKSIDLVLFLIPTAIQQYNHFINSSSLAPIHLFPTISNRQSNKTINELSKNYLKRLIMDTLKPSQSKLDPISILYQWYDLNLIYYLLQYWDYNLLTDLISIVKRDIEEINNLRRNDENDSNSYEMPSYELSILVEMLNLSLIES